MKKYRIREFSPLWWAKYISMATLMVAGIYGSTVLLWAGLPQYYW